MEVSRLIKFATTDNKIKNHSNLGRMEAFSRCGSIMEALRLTACYAFEEIGSHLLEANIQPLNVASIGDSAEKKSVLGSDESSGAEFFSKIS
ncbi:MAG TPA: GNAT family protein [Chthoniobacterales bacterium]|nr:GNAT family protein [Chthoniobacterales bacterium]